MQTGWKKTLAQSRDAPRKLRTLIVNVLKDDSRAKSPRRQETHKAFRDSSICVLGASASLREKIEGRP